MVIERMSRPFLLGLSLSATIAGVAYSHQGATGVVKQRMDAMGEMGDHSSAVADMFKGKAAYDSQVIASAAKVFVQHGKTMTSLFPDTDMSRTGSQTEALPAIWTRWSDFSDLADEFVTRSEELAVLATTTNDKRVLKRNFFKTTKSCSACHKQFRETKK
ncbi:c-type cytochrome [Granulosicoccus sp. 3-233]|uniref:c-type cytochrome n=1 Tax=Granulosicoccus sp. 3-233 TaxID=3417969 RepID=UPI003D34A70F